jgi:C4-dicarboxylate-specific signal transduction histidine kinase
VFLERPFRRQTLLDTARSIPGRYTDRPRELVIRSERPDPNHVRAVVPDIDVGLAANPLEQMFSFFSPSPAVWAWGISISCSIVEVHGGRLEAARNPGPGASF